MVVHACNPSTLEAEQRGSQGDLLSKKHKTVTLATYQMLKSRMCQVASISDCVEPRTSPSMEDTI
jgi:hypothetical protein